MKSTSKKVLTKGKVLPTDQVEVKWAEKSKFHEAGSTSMVHVEQAKKLVETKKATLVKDGKVDKGTEGNDNDGNV